MNSKADPYQVLGVARTASADEIRKAFRASAKECHPDLYPDDPDRADRFKLLSWAHALLTDPVERRRHDDGQRARPRQRPRPEPAVDAAAPRAERKFRFPGIHGADVDYVLQVSAAEARTGVGKPLHTTSGKTLRVAIPPEVRDGHVLRLRGQGLPGKFGGAPGDALVTVQVDLPPGFRREADGIHCEADVPLAVAVLGGKCPVPTLDGSVSLTIPNNSNSGDVLRLRGRGARTKDGGRGDQFVHLRLVLPKPPDPRLRVLLSEWAESADLARAR